MKLLYILPEYLPDSGGGIITFYGQLLPALVDAGYTVKILVCNHQTLDKPSLILNGVEIEYLKSSYVEEARLGCRKFDKPTFWAFLPLAWGAFAQAHCGEGYDIVEATDWLMLYMPWVVSERKARVVVSLHGSNGQVDWFSNPDKNTPDGDWVRLAEVATLGLADAIHANSRSNAQFWETKIHKPIRVIPPILEFSEMASPVMRGSRGLVVGRLQNWKGAEVLCQALEEFSDIEIEWVGSDTQWGNAETANEFLKKNYPSIFGSKLTWLGATDYKNTLNKMQTADFVVVPSTWDVFNLTAAEAMTLGSVVICSRNAGAEMLIEDGINGFLFDPAYPSQLADCIRKVTNLSFEEKKAIGRRAHTSVISKMGKASILDALKESYATALNCRDFSGDEWLFSLLHPNRSNYAKSIASGGLINRVLKKLGG